MQSYDNDELLKTLTASKMEELTDAIHNDPELKNATHHVIGKLPNKGDTIRLNGLEYNVVSVNKLKGHFVAHIKKP